MDEARAVQAPDVAVCVSAQPRRVRLRRGRSTPLADTSAESA